MTIDPTTALSIVVALNTPAGQKIVERLLGPSADYLAKLPPTLADKAFQNIGRILGRMKIASGSRLDSPGSVSPRLLKEVVTDGAFSDDVVTQAYYGGVLASSRCESGNDDRGKPFLAQIARMAAVSIRTHFLIYAAIRNSEELPLDPVPWLSMRFRIEMNEFLDALDITPTQRTNFLPILEHVFFSLGQEGLVSGYGYGVDAPNIPASESSVRFTPTILGVQLFMWAHAAGDKPVSSFADRDTTILLPDDLASAIPRTELISTPFVRKP